MSLAKCTNVGCVTYIENANLYVFWREKDGTTSFYFIFYSICGFTKQPRIIWRADHGDLFSEKSAYNCLKQSRDVLIFNPKGESSDTTQSTLFWKTVWRSKVQDKVKNFIWRAFHNFLTVSINLRTRGCYVRTNCWFCDSPEESAAHVFFSIAGGLLPFGVLWVTNSSQGWIGLETLVTGCGIGFKDCRLRNSHLFSMGYE